MKIFLSFLQSPHKYAIPAYDFWQHFIKNGIEEAGHQWVEYPDADWALGMVPQSGGQQLKWKAETWGKTVAWLKKNRVDLFLSYLYPEQIDTSAIEEIKKMGIPCVNFFCDNVRLFKKPPAEFAGFNLNWVPEHKAINMYQKSGYDYISLPMPIWVHPALRVVQAEANRQITFIGSKDIQRMMLFEEIIQHSPNLNLAVYGSGWAENGLTPATPSPGYSLSKKIHYQYGIIAKYGFTAYMRKLKQRNLSTTVSKQMQAKLQGAISFEEYNRLTATSMITVGINRYPSFNFPLRQPDTYSRLRDIEAPMLGACYLTEYTADLENMYNPGDEIEVYTCAEDFIEKANALQHDNKKREQLKISGQKRALAQHSIPASIGKILTALNLT